MGLGPVIAMLITGFVSLFGALKSFTSDGSEELEELKNKVPIYTKYMP